MRKIFLIFISISILTLCISIVSSARLPTVGGDSDQWGSVLNEFLNVSFNETGELRNDTISTNQIVNGTIRDADISDTTNLTLGDKITFAYGEIIDNLVDGFIRITGGLRVEGTGNFSGTLYINNATDVSVWMYNQTTATFNLYNSTWDNNWLTQMLSANDTSINTTANIQTLLIGTNISQYAFNQTLQTFNTYNSTWDNNWQVALLSANISSINTTNVHQQLLNNTNIYFNQLSIGTPNQVGQFYTVGSSYFNLTGAQIFNIMNTTNVSLFYVNGTNGNVGIGTTSPSSLLHINGSGVVVLRVDGGTQGRFIAIDRGATTDRKIWEFMSDNDNLFIAQINDAETVRTTRLFINGSSGNVGINTTTPGDILTVAGQISITGASRIRITAPNAQAIPNNAWTIVQYNIETYDNLGEYDNAVNYRFTATKAGYYFVSASLLSSSAAWTVGQQWTLSIYKNGVLNSYGSRTFAYASVTDYLHSAVTDVIYLAVNDYIDIRILNIRGASTNTQADANWNFFVVHRLS